MRSRITVPFVVIAVVLGLVAGFARAQDDPHAGCTASPSYVPAGLLDRPLPLRKGVGNSHEAITTASKEAQAFYDQGLNYLESYVWIEASRSFHQALRIDPKCAMAYLGLSYVQTGLDNADGATHYLTIAKELASGVSDRERKRIEIREKQIAAIDDLQDAALFLAYKKCIDDALATNLGDVELWILRGNAEEANATGRGQRGGASSVAFYQQVLSLVPDHATAHHYLVHSYETIGHIDEALAHGKEYARLAPAIPHAAHMWAHDLRRVGRVDDAIAQFKKADRLENAYYAAEKIDPALDWHHSHNLDLLASCYEHKGQMKLAEETFRASATLKPVSAYRAFNMRELPAFLIHRGRYDEALAAARGLTTTDFPQSRCVGHALAGQALIAMGRDDDAKAELAQAQTELEQVPKVAKGIDPARSVVEPWVDGLRGEILLHSRQFDEGDAVLKDVVKRLRATPGPDAWSQGLFRLELMARSAMDAGDWELADFLAAQMLDHDAAYGGSHYTRALVLQHKGDESAAAKEVVTARHCWRDADKDLAELRELGTIGTASGTGRGGKEK
jgi:tetratricopeptide (TPR) repeat protein